MPQPFPLDEFSLPADSELRALLARFPEVEPLRFGDSEYLIPHLDQGRSVYLLLNGTCVVEANAQPELGARPPHLAIVEATPDAPAFLGEMAYLGETTRTAAVRSAMNTWALRLEPEHLDAIIEYFPRLTTLLCRQFTQRLSEANAQLRTYKAMLDLPAAHRFAADGETIFAEGEPSPALFALADGAVTLLQGNEEKTLHAEYGVPTLLDPAAYFLGRAHRYSAIVAGQAFLLVIPPEGKLAATRRFPEEVLELLSGDSPDR